jgi:two-component system, response regulator PdtaR
MSVISHEITIAGGRAADSDPSGRPTDGVGKVDPARRILVASDEASTRSVTTQALIGAGFDVVGQAGSRSQTTFMVSELGPDLLVLDATITGGDLSEPDLAGRIATGGNGSGRDRTAGDKSLAAMGFEAESATSGGGGLVPVVLLTASERLRVTHPHGADVMAVVSKPIYVNKLVPAVEIALARGSDLQALRSRVAETAKLLATHKSIERAKGLLMTRRGMTEPESMHWLQSLSTDLRIPIGLVASTVIEQFSTVG